MAKFPIFLEVGGRRAVVIGGGPVAIRKAEVLVEAGARVVIIDDVLDDLPRELSGRKDVELVKSKYSKEYLNQALLAIAATNSRQVNEQVYRDCQQLEVLCNVVDDPEHCDFFVPATVRRHDLYIAVSTEGSCPAYAGHLRQKLEDIFTEDHGRFLDALEVIRRRILKDIPEEPERKAVLGELVSDESFHRFLDSGPKAWQTAAQELITKHKTPLQKP
jgi:precorrin-2 dehydrogenase/sirohydrochlorin ferrochelatase